MKTRNTNNPVAYNVKKASLILGVPDSILAKRIRQGRIPTFRRHGQLFVPATALVKFLGGERQ